MGPLEEEEEVLWTLQSFSWMHFGTWIIFPNEELLDLCLHGDQSCPWTHLRCSGFQLLIQVVMDPFPVLSMFMEIEDWTIFPHLVPLSIEWN